MRKIISFMHISLDGFVAGPTGELNWITINDELFEHVGNKVSAGDTAMYGRMTYEMMENYWPTAGTKENASPHDKRHSAWYNSIRKIVLSNTLSTRDLNNTIIVSNPLDVNLQQIKQEEGEDIYLFGSPRATHSLINQDLIDGYWLFLNPIILGNGIPLFKNNQRKDKLELLTTKNFDCGVVELLYTRDKS